MDNLLIYVILIFVVIVALAMIFVVSKISAGQGELRRELDQNNAEQRQFNNQMIKFLGDMQKENSNDFLRFTESQNNKISQLQSAINENLKENYKANSEAFLNIQERIVKIDAAQKNLENLSEDILSLQNILQDKKNRGTFGEIELYSLLESAYGIDLNRYQKQYKLSNGSIADAVLFGGESLGTICIDSKFPLENYRRIYDDSLSKDEREKARKMFGLDVKKHINDIFTKYIIKGETSDFAYMFIPSEAIFAEIYGHFNEIVDESYSKHVYLVSPTTLMAYLTAIKSIYLGQQRDNKAKDILKELDALSVDFERFKERADKMDTLFKNLESVFEQFKISTNKISNKFNKINKGDIEDGNN